MTNVQIKGVFMGVNLKTKEFDGKSTTKVHIDLYQPNSDSNNKSLTISTDKVDLFQSIQKDYATGSVFECEASVSAYKNSAYFKLVKIVEHANIK